MLLACKFIACNSHVETECTNTYLYINTDTTHLLHKDHKKGIGNENQLLLQNRLYTVLN